MPGAEAFFPGFYGLWRKCCSTIARIASASSLLSDAEYEVLEMLWKCGGEIKQSELLKKLAETGKEWNRDYRIQMEVTK